MRSESPAGGVPVLRWGDGPRTVVGIHGMFSHREDADQRVLAQVGEALGWSVVTFDLPGHGRRAGEELTFPTAAEELRRVVAAVDAREVAVVGPSLGAYLALTALGDAGLARAGLVAPMLGMAEFIEGVMERAGVTPERLRAEGRIATPETPLVWDDYAYAVDHPEAWSVPTRILRGADDALVPADVVDRFAASTGATVDLLPGAGHWLHTPAELTALRRWLDALLGEDR